MISRLGKIGGDGILNHEAKVEVAGQLAERLGQVYGDKIYVVLVDGSVARGEDSEYSDLELRVITSERIRTKRMSEDGYAEIVYRDLPVLLQFLTKDEAIKMIHEPDYYWPIRIWCYLEPIVVGGSADKIELVLAQFQKAKNELRTESFRGAILWALTWTWEALNKVKGGEVTQTLCLITEGAQHLADASARLIALVNQRYFHHSDCRYLDTIKGFEKLPRDFATLWKTLNESRDMQQLMQAAEMMWRNCLEFAAAEGYSMEAYDKLADVYAALGLNIE